jgi:hypothetical protein
MSNDFGMLNNDKRWVPAPSHGRPSGQDFLFGKVSNPEMRVFSVAHKRVPGAGCSRETLGERRSAENGLFAQGR